MKSTIDTSTKPEAIFPVLMQSVANGYVVMFTGENTGTIVYDPNNFYGLGNYGDDWQEWYKEEYWKKFEGTITLEN